MLVDRGRRDRQLDGKVEPLRWMLDDPRVMRMTRQSDSLWIRLLDIKAALEARSYDSGGTIVLEIASDPMCPASLPLKFFHPSRQ